MQEGFKLKVMIIEDEPVIRYALVKMVNNLNVIGFEPKLLTEVEYAEYALDYLKETTYDIVFVDIEGGELSGLDLINQYRNKHLDTQWIIISGYNRFDYAQKAILYGVQEYLLKPITKDKLASSVEKSIEKIYKKQNGFIGMDKIEEFILSLEAAIWDLEDDLVQYLIDKWTTENSKIYFSIRYYNNVMSYVLEMLFFRVKDKGAILTQSIQDTINVNSMERVNKKFQEACLKMIALIRNERRGNEIDPIETAKEFILENIEKEISLEDVAAELGFNASYFSQIFKQKTGQTFVKYRTNLRMQRAKEILLRHDVRIIDIPFMIGLNDHPHFTKTFKEKTGYTPSGYRRKMGII